MNRFEYLHINLLIRGHNLENVYRQVALVATGCRDARLYEDTHRIINSFEYNALPYGDNPMAKAEQALNKPISLFD